MATWWPCFNSYKPTFIIIKFQKNFFVANFALKLHFLPKNAKFCQNYKVKMVFSKSTFMQEKTIKSFHLKTDQVRNSYTLVKMKNISNFGWPLKIPMEYDNRRYGSSKMCKSKKIHQAPWEKIRQQIFLLNKVQILCSKQKNFLNEKIFAMVPLHDKIFFASF